MRYRPRIRTVLLLVNLTILCLPVLGIQALRLYESELIRQTEASLISEGVYIREQYVGELEKGVSFVGASPPRPRQGAGVVGALPPLPLGGEIGPSAPLPLEPIQASLDIAQAGVQPKAPEATPALMPADPAALAAGAALSPLLRSSQRYTLAGIRIVDAHGVVVASSRGELGLSLLARDEVRQALAGKTARLIRERASDEAEPVATETPFGGDRPGRIRVFLALPVSQAGHVVGAVILSRTPLDIQKALYLNRFPLLRFVSGLLLLVALAAILTAKTISRPLRALIRQAKEVGSDVRKAAEPLEHPGSREVAELSEAIAAMARALQARSEYVHTFAQHVSHEFKTPLAAFHGIVELLRDHLDTMRPEERTRFLDMLSGNATRMQKLVERLLLLAKADAALPQSAEASGSCALVPVLEGVAARGRWLGLDVALAPLPADIAPTASVRMAAETLDSVLTTLLDNAKQHGGPGVKVRLEAAPAEHRDGGAVSLTVADDGPGISPANRGRVFTPFFTTARETGGTGLGLSIVRSLVEAHGGRVTIDEGSDGRGVAVAVTLPLA